jgi:phosphohistidine phosphatase
MKLLLQQHGKAEPKSAGGERELTDESRAEIDGTARLLSAAGVRVQQVLHSGKTRALQTAEIMARRIAPDEAPRAMSGMAPNDPVEPFVATLEGLDCNVLAVGHQPFMGRLVSTLLIGNAEPALALFVPGSVVCLERDPGGRMAVAWMVTPGILQGGRSHNEEGQAGLA